MLRAPARAERALCDSEVLLMDVMLQSCCRVKSCDRALFFLRCCCGARLRARLLVELWQRQQRVGRREHEVEHRIERSRVLSLVAPLS